MNEYRYRQDWARLLVKALPRTAGLVITTQQGIPRVVEAEARAEGFQPCMKVPLGAQGGPNDDKEAFKQALSERNQNFMRRADIVVCFYDGRDYGVNDIIKMATTQGKPVVIISDHLDDEIAKLMFGAVTALWHEMDALATEPAAVR